MILTSEEKKSEYKNTNSFKSNNNDEYETILQDTIISLEGFYLKKKYYMKTTWRRPKLQTASVISHVCYCFHQLLQYIYLYEEHNLLSSHFVVVTSCIQREKKFQSFHSETYHHKFEIHEYCKKYFSLTFSFIFIIMCCIVSLYLSLSHTHNYLIKLVCLWCMMVTIKKTGTKVKKNS